ncbi:MAG: alpha-mannosidase, partial [Opitutae bacterium]|nr:alpha-mannosidase [Opitutae bacterium]
YYPAYSAATPGPVVFHTEVSANGYNTTDDRDMGVCRYLRYGLFRREVWNLMNDFRAVQSLLEIHQKPPYVIPGGYHWNYKSVDGPADRRAARLCMVLNRAIDVFAENPENAAAAREVLRPELERPAQGDELSTTAVGHAHLDIGFRWRLAETRRKACRTFVGQLANIRRYPGYVFGASQAQLYEFVRERMPAVYEEVRHAVKAGSWELQGGMWCEADCNLPSGESLLRQFIHGKNFWRDEFGVEVRNLWLPDSFGYPAALPQIMKLAGCRYFMAQKLSWNEFNRFPHHTFRWLGHDDSEVICHFLAEDNYNAYLDPAALHFAEDNYQENHLCDEFLTIFGAGDGGGGP